MTGEPYLPGYTLEWDTDDEEPLYVVDSYTSTGRGEMARVLGLGATLLPKRPADEHRPRAEPGR